MIDELRKILTGNNICVADVGAADGLAKRWRPVAPILQIVAFEPDARSDVAADTKLGAKVTVISKAAAASEGEAKIYLTRKPRCSSLYEPNREVISRYPDPERYDVVREGTVSCTTVDAAFKQVALSMDFIKIDTQGTELDVLRGAAESLKNCLGAEIEVEFQKLYNGACTFRDIDGYVSDYGLELFDIRRTFFTRLTAQETQQKGQIVFGDALYFRNWRSLDDPIRVIKLAVLLLVYGFGDVVADIIQSCPLLTPVERSKLKSLCGNLRPVPGVEADRKDYFVGSGLQLKF